MAALQDEFFELSDRIERQFPVADWHVGGIPVWPVLRISLPHAVAARADAGAFVIEPPIARLMGRASQILHYAATPLANALRRRGHGEAELSSADALFLGTGATYDCFDGVLQDRFCEPLIATLGAHGRASLLMEDGDVRVPQSRPVFAANGLDRAARLRVRFGGSGTRLPAHLPGHGDMLELLRREELPTHYFDEGMARYHAALIATLAERFDRILARTRPSLVFMVRYYCEMGYALSLACRRRGILSVELQHGGQAGQHEAYNGFLSLPPEGYSILPAVFWNWTHGDADAINLWAERLSRPWHRAIHGGHPQLLSWLDDANPRTRAFEARIAALQSARPGDRDILVALQDMPAFAPVWDALADVIKSAPPTWRWWLRRHPSPLYSKGVATRKILALDLPNVEIEQASSMPLPALLRHMDAVLCHSSGTIMEASAFGVPSIFLSENARGLFRTQIDGGDAEIITGMDALMRRLSHVRNAQDRKVAPAQPPISATLARLDAMAEDYRRLCAGG